MIKIVIYSLFSFVAISAQAHDGIGLRELPGLTYEIQESLQAPGCSYCQSEPQSPLFKDISSLPEYFNSHYSCRVTNCLERFNTQMRDNIIQASRAFDLNATFLACLLFAENMFSDEPSYVGAQGPAQIMPSTMSFYNNAIMVEDKRVELRAQLSEFIKTYPNSREGDKEYLRAALRVNTRYLRIQAKWRRYWELVGDANGVAHSPVNSTTVHNPKVAIGMAALILQDHIEVLTNNMIPAPSERLKYLLISSAYNRGQGGVALSIDKCEGTDSELEECFWNACSSNCENCTYINRIQNCMDTQNKDNYDDGREQKCQC